MDRRVQFDRLHGRAADQRSIAALDGHDRERDEPRPVHGSIGPAVDRFQHDRGGRELRVLDLLTAGGWFDVLRSLDGGDGGDADASVVSVRSHSYLCCGYSDDTNGSSYWCHYPTRQF